MTAGSVEPFLIKLIWVSSPCVKGETTVCKRKVKQASFLMRFEDIVVEEDWRPLRMTCPLGHGEGGPVRHCLLEMTAFLKRVCTLDNGTEVE